MPPAVVQPNLAMDLIVPTTSLTFRFPNVPSGRDTSWTVAL